MFYGSGAGKLPTASAVVGDVVEAAKNPARSMMSTWSSEKLELIGKEDTVKKFFVRVSGNVDTLLEKVTEVFGKVEVVTLENKENEFGFVTESMSEGCYEASAAKLPEICHMIRVE